MPIRHTGQRLCVTHKSPSVLAISPHHHVACPKATQPSKPGSIPDLVSDKSIGYFREWLLKHLQHHNIPIEALRSFQTVFAYTSSLGLRVRFEVRDDRDKLHTRTVMH